MAELQHVQRFEELALPHLDAAYNLARWLTRNDHDAHDVVQEAYLRAFKFFAGFHGDNARSWLLAIVRNTCYTWLRQNRGFHANTSLDELLDSGQADAMLAAAEPPEDGPEKLMQQADNKAMLNRVLEKLPEEFREALVLKELEDLSYREIAAVTGVPLGTVMSRLSRARKLLSKQLQEYMPES
ncbi:MAG: sigma-70 family RNA polymerase sigma factor [Sulfuricaulis sp.]